MAEEESRVSEAEEGRNLCTCRPSIGFKLLGSGQIQTGLMRHGGFPERTLVNE